MQVSVDVERYRKWILQRSTESFPVTENEDGNLEIESVYGLGRVNFYDGDIIELRVDTIKENKTEFFLHFQLNNIQKAKDLYIEMEEAMCNLKNNVVTKIVLSCSSALTTSYFAELLNNAAQSMNLKYSFSAVSIDRLEENAKDADMILLAPQVHYARKKIVEKFPNVLVRNIPSQTFGKYDTGELIDVIKGELLERDYSRTPKYERTQSFFQTQKKILTVGYVNGGDGKDSSVVYRYYKNGDIACSGEVKLEGVSVENLEDIIDPLIEKYPEIETIGLSLPGTIEDGVVFLPGHPIHLQNIIDILHEKYHRIILAFNDANMIVTGIYWLEDCYKSLVLYFLPSGEDAAGCGIVVNGHLLRGIQHVAGEVKYTQNVLNLSDTASTLLKSEDGTYELISKSLVTIVATLGPQAIFVHSQKTPDMDRMKELMSHYIDSGFLPDMYYLENVSEYMMTGTFLRCIWRMDDFKRMEFGLTHNPYQ